MLAIFGEAKSDTEMLKVLVRRLAGDSKLPVKPKSYTSCSHLVRKIKGDLIAFERLGYSRFIICYDADGPNPNPRYDQMKKIVKDSGVSSCCILIPVEEIEAWILADVKAVTKLFPSWFPPPKIISSPESVTDPKETLIRLSRISGKKPLYDYVNDNHRIAHHLDLERVFKLCPSFVPLREFMQAG